MSSHHHSLAAMPAHFPEQQLEWRELAHLRSWQATPLVTVCYYFYIVVAIIMFISMIVNYTVAYGVGGFFLGLLYGLITALGLVLVARVLAEVVLSLFSIRDNVAHTAANGNTIGSGNAPHYSPPSAPSTRDETTIAVNEQGYQQQGQGYQSGGGGSAASAKQYDEL